MMFSKLLAFGGIVGAWAISVCNCSGDSAEGETFQAGPAGPSTGATGATDGGGGFGGGISGCDPACVAPQFCSGAHVCIDEGTCAADADCSEGRVCDLATSACVPGTGCGSMEVTAEAVPPNMLIVLDRSCSMRDPVGSTDKWTIAVSAISQMEVDFASQIRFGLTLFPDLVTPSCGQGAIPIPVAPGNEGAIQDLLNKSLMPSNPYYPDGPCVTNIDTAMQQAAAEPAFDDMSRKSYVVLVTDGMQSACSLAGGDSGTTQIIADLYKTKGVATFVLGFGSGIDPVQMNTFADAGGIPNSDPSKPNQHYYDAEDQASLQAVLSAIASKTLGCVFQLDATPPDKNTIYVFFDNNPAGVAKDPAHVNGWDYDPTTNQVTFYGPACDQLKTGDVTDVDIVFGCKAPTPH